MGALFFFLSVLWLFVVLHIIISFKKIFDKQKLLEYFLFRSNILILIKVA